MAICLLNVQLRNGNKVSSFTQYILKPLFECQIISNDNLIFSNEYTALSTCYISEKIPLELNKILKRFCAHVALWYKAFQPTQTPTPVYLKYMYYALQVHCKPSRADEYKIQQIKEDFKDLLTNFKNPFPIQQKI